MSSIYPKSFFSENKEDVQKATCFVLMPFAKNFDPVFKLIKRTLETDIHMECKRSDDFHKPHIIDTILKGITKCEYIIADLTEANPNVFYELGLAHCEKNIENVIILSQNLDYVPFDLQQFRCIIYQQSPYGFRILKNKLINTFNEISKNIFRIRLEENKKVLFKNKLSGKGNFLYGLTLESPYVGYDGIKIQISFTQYGADKTIKQLETQYNYLGTGNPTKKIDHIPWAVTLLQINGMSAIVSIEEDKSISEPANKEFEKVEIEASFPGEDSKWRQFLERNLNSEVATRNGAPSGTYIVIIQFVVGRDGKISDLKPMTSHGYGMEQEAIRVINKSPRWNPAIQNTRTVKAYRKQPITFVIS